MNYFNYIKKQGFKKSTSKVLISSNRYYSYNPDTEGFNKSYLSYKHPNEFISRLQYFHLGYRYDWICWKLPKDIDMKKEQIKCHVPCPKFNQFEFDLDEDMLYVQLFRTCFNVILINKEWDYYNYIAAENLNMEDGGVFNFAIQKTIGDVKYRNFIVRQLTNNELF